MGGVARYFAQPRSLSELQSVVLWGRAQNIPLAVLGSGSNCVFADDEFAGLVISLELLNHWHWEQAMAGGGASLWCEAGVTNTEIAEICAAANRKGAAWMHRMPGQLGASIRMNARCYGGETSEIVMEVLSLDVFGTLKLWQQKDIFLGYKKTAFMDRPEMIVAARLFFPEQEEATALISQMQACESNRHEKRHFYLPSCGSTFKNNHAVGKPSGVIFDELGLKGTRVGACEVSQYHANFIWNTGQAKTVDLLNLTAQMKKVALEKKGADLELEVQPIGVFSQKLFDACGMNKLGSNAPQSGGRCVGTLWHPKQTLAALESFPRLLFSSPFVEYGLTDAAEVPPIVVEVLQLCSLAQARAHPHLPFLQWKTKTTASSFEPFFPLRPKAGSPAFLDELWRFSVSEIFFAHPTLEHYSEFEMTPDGHWVALAFQGVRHRTIESAKPSAHLWEKGVQVFAQIPSEFSMTFSHSILENLIADRRLRMQCALSLGSENYFLAPYWKDAGRADFHQPERYWNLQLFEG